MSQSERETTSDCEHISLNTGCDVTRNASPAQRHPLSSFLGDFSATEFNELKSNIGSHAVLEPPKAGLRSSSATVAGFRPIREVVLVAGTSERNMDRAVPVVRSAIPLLKEAAEAAQIPVGHAERIAQPAPEQQQQALDAHVNETTRTRKSPARLSSAAHDLRVQPEHCEDAPGPTRMEYNELQEKWEILVEETARLEKRLAVHFSEGTPEEKNALVTLVSELQREVGRLTHEVVVLKDSRDRYMREAGELKRQCARDQAFVKRLKRELGSGSAPAARAY
jgi:hypothetical protein